MNDSNLPPQESVSPLLTTEQVANWLGFHPASLRNSRHKKSLGIPFVRIGGAIRYRPEDVEAFIARNREGGSK